MNFRKLGSVLAGFVTIGLLSSIFAKIHGILSPSSLEIFTNPALAASNPSQLVIKLLYVYFSCFMGGVITTWMRGRTRENLIVGGITILLEGWLWMSVIHPVWFWILLILGVLPGVFLGSKLTRMLISKTPPRH